MSVSKTLTAALTLKLIEEGRLSLDDRPFALFNYPTPTYRGASRDARLDQITVRHCLNHSAGWVWDQVQNPIIGGTGFYPTNHQREIAQLMGATPPGTAETMIRYMVGQPLQAAPGTVYRYTALGYLVLGRIIELKTGLSYERAVQQFLGESYLDGLDIGATQQRELADDEAVYYDYPGAPLQQSHFGLGLVPGPYAYSLQGWDAAGGWRGSAIEGLRLLLALDAKNGTPPLLRPASVMAMQSPQFPSATYGYGWETQYYSSGGYAGHGGGSWGSKTMVLRTTDGLWHLAVFLNSLPADALNGGSAFETQLWEAVKLLPQNYASPAHDLTWSTLGWKSWLRRHFADRPAAELDDEDGDGVPNLLEYATGLDPNAAEAQVPASLEISADGSSVLTYRRLPLAHALDWAIETADSNPDWRAAAGAPRSTTLNVDGTLKVVMPLLPARLVRLSVARKGQQQRASMVFDLATLGAPKILVHPVSRTLQAGGAIEWSVQAESMTPPTYQWLRNGQPIPGATAPAFRLEAVAPADAGIYTVVVENALGSSVSRPAQLVVAQPEPGRLVNLSVRAYAGVGGQPLIVGFVVTGGARRLLLRAVGPGLAAFVGADGLLADPRIEVHHSVGGTDRVVAANDDWGTAPSDPVALAKAFASVGAFPLPSDSRDAAVLIDLEGPRSAHVRGPEADRKGIVLVEAYDTGQGNTPRLINLSARNHVGLGDDALIAGFVINGNVPKRLLIRGVGPELKSRFFVVDALADPRLELHAAGGAAKGFVAGNDDWGSESGAAEAAALVGAFPLEANSRDAALVVTLPSGSYSVVVRGARSTTGNALIEVYELPDAN